MTTAIATDLLTPLGAYLRLRDGGRGSFLLESVEHGRLGRYSFVGAGTRLVYAGRSRGARAARRRLRGVRPRREARADRAAARRRPGPAGEPLRRRGHARPLRPRRAESPTCSTAMPTRSTRRLPPVPRGDGKRGVLRRFPDQARARAARAEGEGVHPRGRRVPDRRRAARRAPDVRVGARALPRASAHQPVAVPLPARARRARAHRLFAGDGRQMRRRARRAESDRGLDRAGRRRRRGAAQLGEGPRRARDARRPRAQRPLTRLQAGHGARRALSRAGALLAHHAPRLGGRRRVARRRRLRSTCCARASPPGTVSGAPKIRAMQIISELEGYRRGIYGGAVGYSLPRRRARHVHRDPHDRPHGRASRGCRPEGGSSPTRIRPKSTRSA